MFLLCQEMQWQPLVQTIPLVAIVTRVMTRKVTFGQSLAVRALQKQQLTNAKIFFVPMVLNQNEYDMARMPSHQGALLP